MNQDRQIRVFISSTFRDMMRERDLLVKEVFPALRRKCVKRFVTFTEVDLRWGITEEQASEGQVLPLCLAEIERSRPYFIGLLGERYGWIPDTIRPEVIEREPWLQEHVQGRTSVTELEILHGVLNNPDMRRHAFFYFRDPAYANDPALTEDERREVVERNIWADVQAYGEAEATRRTQERQAKLAVLKQRIRASGLPLVEPYAGPKALAETVHEQFDKLIDELYPEEGVPDALARERLAHEAQAKNKLYACIDRPAHLAALTEFAERAHHGGKGLVVTGESGGGKTALLAAWVREWAGNAPDDFLFQHYFGATPDSSTPEGFLSRLLGELKQRFGITEALPSHPDKLREALPLWLAQASATLTRPVGHPLPSDGRGAGGEGQARIVLVLDGLNQVRGSEPDRRLAFLPRHFPPHVTLVASALPGPALDALRERGWWEHELPLATEPEADAMVAEYFRLLGRHVDAEGRPIETPLRRQVVTAPGSKNPLFLRTVLEELRQFGSFEKLPARVAHYLEAQNPKDLFLRVIRRWQEDFDAKDSTASSGIGMTPSPPSEGGEGRGEVGAVVQNGKPVFVDGGAAHLVRRALTHLWAAREGLSETEWLDLLGSQPSELTSDPLPRALWTPLFLALEPHLSQRAGLFAFGHDFLREASAAEFLPTEHDEHAAHIVLADYFVSQPEMTPRKSDEWPWQLQEAEEWDRLQQALTDRELFLSLYKSVTDAALGRYWVRLREARPAVQIGRLYQEAFALWEREKHEDSSFASAANDLGVFLKNSACFEEAERLLRRALEIRERCSGPDYPDIAVFLNNLASLLGDTNRLSEAEPLYRRALEINEQRFPRDHPDVASSITNLGHLLVATDRLSEAEPLMRRALKIHERWCGPGHPNVAWSLGSLALVLKNTNRLSEAEVLVRRALEIDQRFYGMGHPRLAIRLNNLGMLLADTGRLPEAESLYRRALEIHERSYGPSHPKVAVSLNNVASALYRMDRDPEAASLLRRALEIDEQAYGPDHPQVATGLHNLALALEATNHLSEAGPLMRRHLEIFLKFTLSTGHQHPHLQAAARSYAGLLSQKGRSPAEVQTHLNAIGRPFGIQFGDGGES